MTSMHPHPIPDRFPAAVQNHTRKLHPPSRPLGDEEIRALRERGNHAGTWANLRVSPDFDPERVVGCQFLGRCYLGTFGADQEPGGLPQGVYFSTLRDTVVESGTSIHRCSMIDGYRISSGASVLGSSVRCGGGTTFGNGTRIEPGIETGGRALTLLADLDMNLVVELCLSGDARRASEIDAYLGRVESPVGHIGAGTIVRNCSSIVDSWIGDAAILEDASLVADSTILSSVDDPVRIGAGCIVRRSIVHGGTSVTDGGLVDSSLMLEHSHVERHGKLTTSVVGANSVVGEGEITASVVGPFTACHHQALLIAAYWPAGKGNVGYGANIGSNHTSRLPDQEIWPGEGMFFGLGCNVTFPADFSRSPYTIISTGVTTLPQKLEMPFSVISTPTVSTGTPPGLMQLRPAWVLRENIYALVRNEAKYRTRNKARTTNIDTAVFRDDVVGLMQTARDSLADCAETKPIYLPGDLPGIGKNFLTEEDRLAAIEAYDRYIEYAALRLEAESILAVASDESRSSEISDAQRSSLGRYIAHRRSILADARRSREKDWRRGIACIDDYERTHPSVDDDAVIQALTKEIAEQEALIDRLGRL